LWCLPVVSLIVGLNWQKARPMLWIPALLVMAARHVLATLHDAADGIVT
jgi:hypothetical protein